MDLIGSHSVLRTWGRAPVGGPRYFHSVESIWQNPDHFFGLANEIRAHTPRHDPRQWDPIDDHLRAVASACARFAEELGLREPGEGQSKAGGR